MSTASPKKSMTRARGKNRPQPVVQSAAQEMVGRVQPEPVRRMLPIAKWMGFIELANATIDCYVLEDGRRVLSINGAVKALSGLETGHGRLDKYIGVTALRPYIDSQSVMDGLIEFEIPGSNNNFGNARGLSTDDFERIMGAFIDAMAAEATLTQNQMKMAIRCAVLSRGLVRTGLTALVDEATGYQKNRKEDELQVRLRAFISSELRPWERTFPDDLWEQFGRLTGWKDSLTNRPRYWGKLVIKFIYDTLPEGVAEYLKNNRPPKGVMWHQQLTENYGVQRLVTRCIEVATLARTCRDMQELSEKVALHFGRKPMQFSLSDLMNEERPLGVTKRLAKDLRRKAREREIAKVIPSYAAGRIVDAPASDPLLFTEEPAYAGPHDDDGDDQPSLLDIVMMDMPSAPDGDVSAPIPDDIAEMLKAADLEEDEGGAETAHERLAVGRSTRRPTPSDDRVVPTRFGERADDDPKLQDLLDHRPRYPKAG
jgi:hypothetical protein